MRFLRTALDELLGMFIDDGALALASVILIVVIAAAVEWVGLPPLAGGIVLLVGLVVILGESCLRAARKKLSSR